MIDREKSQELASRLKEQFAGKKLDDIVKSYFKQEASQAGMIVNFCNLAGFVTADVRTDRLRVWIDVDTITSVTVG